MLTTTVDASSVQGKIVGTAANNIMALDANALAPAQIPYDANTGKYGFLTATKELRVTKTIRLIGSMFSGVALDPQFWVSSGTGTGAIVCAGTMVTLSTGATADSTVKLQTINKARYLTASNNLYRGNIRLPEAGALKNVRRWGAFDVNNGFYFALNAADATVSIGSRTNASGSPVDAALTATTFTPNTTLHTYEIVLANKTVYFLADDAVIGTLSQSAAPLSATMDLKVGVENNNSAGGTANVSVECRNMCVLRMGDEEGAPRYLNIAANGTYYLKAGMGHLDRVTINKKGTVNNTLTVYDSLTAGGAVIASIDTVAAPGGDFPYNVTTQNGLTVVLAGNTAADLTIAFD